MTDPRTERRWLVWRHRDGKKPPVHHETGEPLSGWADPSSWVTREEAEARWRARPGLIDGVGFALGDGWGGLDLDECRDATTGVIDARAEAVLRLVESARVEVSPSGRGLKVVGRAPRWLELTFRAGSVDVRPAERGYFTMTGDVHRDGQWDVEVPVDAIAAHFGAGQAEERPRAKVMPDEVRPGAQNSTLFREACALRRRGYKAAEVAAALWAMVESGRFPPESGRARWSRREVDQMAARVCATYAAGEDDFTRDKDGVPHRTSENVRRAFRMLGARPRLDRFAQQAVVDRDGVSLPMNDETMRDLYYSCTEGLKFKPSRAEFHDVAHHMAERDDFHPVRDYLADLSWDGVPRINSWLTTYAGAEASDYARAVGRLVLVAAVRRVRRPGCKFDELLVLESQTQGLDKSNLLRRLCPNSEWFSETLMLAADSKVVIERTSGVWIAEAAEMVGSGKDIDRLKSFLSTSVDGPVRLAYAREPVKVPRQFVVIGTTNHAQYLRDLTGNRRFWPVKIGTVDLVAVERDRDQLWAEAAQAEASGESIRLDRTLWAAASAEQERRRVQDPWEDTILEAFGEGDVAVSAKVVWRVVGVPVERRTQSDNERLGTVMLRLKFARCTLRDRETRAVCRGWRRGDPSAPIVHDLGQVSGL